MQDQHFDEPVRVALGRSRNAIYKVKRVAQAADIRRPHNEHQSVL